MALSGSTTFSVNRNELILSSLRLANVIDPSETPTAQEIVDASEVLNMILKGWMKDGLHLWLKDEIPITLIASQPSYTIGVGGDNTSDRPLRVLNAFIRDSNVDTQLDVISRQEYDEYSDKASTGVPNSVYYDPQLNLGTLFVYLTPNAAAAAAKTIHLTVSKPISDMNSATDDFEIPQEWYRPLRWNLAFELAIEFGMADMKPRMFEKLERWAVKLHEDAKAWDVENTSTFFSPEYRG